MTNSEYLIAGLKDLKEDILESARGLNSERSGYLLDAAAIVQDHIHCEEIWMKVDAMTPEQINAELRAAGIDPEAALKQFKEVLDNLQSKTKDPTL